MIATIFLGPSLPVLEAREIFPEGIFRPPAAQGDLIRAVSEDGADVIGLVDGYFHHELSVWHSEVCYVLSQGVTVLGASSMGALRAVETERFGSVGVGTVFRWYRDGTIDADDEVALAHGDADSGYAQVSIPLVNVRASLDTAVADGRIDRGDADLVVAAIRPVYFPERSLPRVLAACEEVGLGDGVRAEIELALTEGYVDIKRADAVGLVEFVRSVVDGSTPRPPRSDFEFARSGVFEALYDRDRRLGVGDRTISLGQIREHAALHAPDFDRIRRAALDRGIVSSFGMVLGIVPEADDLDVELRAFREERGLHDDQLLHQWLKDNAMTRDDLTRYLAEEAICNRLRRWIVGGRGLDKGCRALLDEARVDGCFTGWVRAASQDDLISEAYGSEREYRDLADADPRWLAAVHDLSGSPPIGRDIRQWADHVGFDDVEDLVEALRRSVVCRDVERRIDRQVSALARLHERAGTADVS